MTKKYFKNDRKEMMEFVPVSANKVLEVGCANGIFGAEIIKRQNAEVWGIEPNESAAKQAELVLHKVINKTFTSKINLPQNYFDCIIFNDVLEHMIDPWDILRFSSKLLNDHSNAVIVASIPNFRFIGNLFEILIKKDFRYKEVGILDKTHYRFFTYKSIIRLFKESGFEIKSIKGINNTKHFMFTIINLITFGICSDMKPRQFAIVAKKN